MNRSDQKQPAVAYSRSPLLRSFASIRDFQNSIGSNSEEAIHRILGDVCACSNLNVYITETAEIARSQAREADAFQSRSRPRPLDGVPISIKDNFCTKGIRTTAGSRILTNFIPTYESSVTRKIFDAGAICLGKTNMDEFGMGSSTENSYFGPTINPRGLALGLNNIAPGGSSGGSAAAVAAHLCLGALGTDTGGSIRQPAAFCGVVGMKPTYGLCSRSGIIAYASSLDQAGAIARTVEDVAILMNTIVGEDGQDSTSAQSELPNLEQFLRTRSSGYRIGIPREFRSLSINQDLEACWRVSEAALRGLRHQIRYVSIPSIQYALPTYYIIALSEASSNLSRYDGVRYGFRSTKAANITELYENTRADAFNWETKKRIIMGTYSLSAGYYDAYYKKACQVRALLSDEFRLAFKEVDCLIWPTAPTPAFTFGSHNTDPLAMYLEDVFTVPVNLAGLPAISIPVSIAQNGLPMGLQIIGAQLSDAHVLRVAHGLESEIGQMALVSYT
jgi:aspartyl-tRNA(Asn)/glutamyl-tRNA(Gln) amidotransferase subunit A